MVAVVVVVLQLCRIVAGASVIGVGIGAYLSCMRFIKLDTVCNCCRRRRDGGGRCCRSYRPDALSH